MSQVETKAHTTMILNLTTTAAGYTVLTAESELHLITLLAASAGGIIEDPRKATYSRTGFTEQSREFQQAMLNLAIDGGNGIEESTFFDTMTKIAAMCKKVNEAEQANTEIGELIGRLGTNEKFKDLIKSLTGEGPTYQITETVVAAIVPIIEELGWRKGSTPAPHL